MSRKLPEGSRNSSRSPSRSSQPAQRSASRGRGVNLEDEQLFDAIKVVASSNIKVVLVLVLVGVALTSLLFAGVIIPQTTANVKAKFQSEYEKEQGAIGVATIVLPEGTPSLTKGIKVDENFIKDYVTVLQMPKRFAASNAITDIQAVLDKYADITLTNNQQLTYDMFIEKSNSIKANERTVRIKVSDDLGGTASPGMLVDLVLKYTDSQGAEDGNFDIVIPKVTIVKKDSLAPSATGDSATAQAPTSATGAASPAPSVGAVEGGNYYYFNLTVPQARDVELASKLGNFKFWQYADSESTASKKTFSYTRAVQMLRLANVSDLSDNAVIGKTTTASDIEIKGNATANAGPTGFMFKKLDGTDGFMSSQELVTKLRGNGIDEQLIKDLLALQLLNPDASLEKLVAMLKINTDDQSKILSLVKQ